MNLNESEDDFFPRIPPFYLYASTFRTRSCPIPSKPCTRRRQYRLRMKQKEEFIDLGLFELNKSDKLLSHATSFFAILRCRENWIFIFAQIFCFAWIFHIFPRGFFTWSARDDRNFSLPLVHILLKYFLLDWYCWSLNVSLANDYHRRDRDGFSILEVKHRTNIFFYINAWCNGEFLLNFLSRLFLRTQKLFCVSLWRKRENSQEDGLSLCEVEPWDSIPTPEITILRWNWRSSVFRWETHKIPERRSCSLCKEKLWPINLPLDARRGRSLMTREMKRDSIASHPFTSIFDHATWNFCVANRLRSLDPWRRRQQHLKIFAKPNRSVIIGLWQMEFMAARLPQLFSSRRPSPNANRDKRFSSRGTRRRPTTENMKLLQ